MSELNLKNELNEGLYFKDLLTKTLQYINGEITADDFSAWGDTLTLRTSLPAMTKLAILMTIMNEALYTGSETQEINVLELYRNLFFYLYLQGYLGIPDISEEDVNYDNWDLLEPIFGPWIENVAKRDIDIFKEMMKTTIDFYGTASVTELMNGIDYKSIEENAKANKALIDSLNENKELIADLKEIATIENPAAAKLTEVIREKAVKDAREKAKEDIAVKTKMAKGKKAKTSIFDEGSTVDMNPEDVVNEIVKEAKKKAKNTKRKVETNAEEQ